MWRFLRSEMMVILGLTEDADRTDAQVADLFGMNKGTVAAVRKRLLDAGAIYMLNVPSFDRLGCELMAVHLGSTDPAVPSDDKTNSYIGFCDGSASVFNGMIGGGNVLLNSVFRDATELETFNQEHNRYFSGARRSSKAKMDFIMFPYALTKGTFVTNFAPAVHDFFHLDVPHPTPRPLTSAEVTTPDLTANERRTFLELVSSPRSSDRELASRIGLSRQAVTRIRSRLFEEGYLSKVCVPRLYKWGFEICVVTHTKFNTEMRWDIRLKSEPRESADLSFMTLSKADEAVVCHMVPRYQEYVERQERVQEWYHKMRVFDEPPRTTVFSLDRCTELRSFDFVPAVRALLGRV